MRSIIIGSFLLLCAWALTVDFGSLCPTDHAHHISPYLGGGLAWYKEGTYQVSPMVSGGVDFRLLRRCVIVTGGNLLFKEGDTDLELLGGIGIILR